MFPQISPSQPSPPETISLPAAPTYPEDDPGQNMLSTLLPLTGVLGSMAMVISMGPGGSAGRGLFMAAALLLSTCAVVLAQVARQRLQRRRTVERARHEHLHALDAAARLLAERASTRRDRMLARWPDPTSVRTPAPAPDAPGDGLHVRLGICEVEQDVMITRSEPSPGISDPIGLEALDRFVDAHSHVSGMPLTVRLNNLQHLRYSGPAEALDEVARALVLSCASSHRPEQVAIGILCAPAELARWDWTKWLPHTRSRSADPSAPRLVDHRASHLLARAPDGRHLIVLTTASWSRLNPELVTEELPEEHTVIALNPSSQASSPAPGELHVSLSASSAARASAHASLDPPLPRTRYVQPDRCSLADANALARRLAACTPQPTSDAPHADDTRWWSPPAAAPRDGEDLLRVEIGTDSANRPIHLDLKEASQGGHGPHGLLVGATGSGKSELLRALVTTLVSAHVPEDLALVLVDFKGGATFTTLADLPHVAACVTNLCDDVTLVDRMQDALTGEMERRQELLHTSGHPSITAYRAARSHGARLEPLPHLFICVDEFSELLTARPEFVELFTAIGRLGRSLGLHLLLASQRLEEGRMHALEAHLSYRIALRTFSAQESRAAIGTPEAHTLPRSPGAGLLRTGADDLSRFTAHHLGAPAPGTQTNRHLLPYPVVFTAAGHRGPSPHARPSPESSVVPSTIGDLLDLRLHEEATRHVATRRVWLPPLVNPVSLGQLLGPLATTEERGLHAPRWCASDELHVPVGVVDLPRRQRHDMVAISMDGARGHVAIVGAPRSGRSTAAQTLVCALALSRTPSELAVHLLDLAGGALTPLAGLPHVVSHVTRGQGSMLERVVAHVESVVETREAHPERPSGRLLLVIDGWGTLRSEHDDLERRLVTLAPRALAVGVHLVLTALRWSELRPSFLDVVASRIELRLGDPFDSTVDRRAAASVPVDRPGRGIVAGAHAMLMALPELHAAGDGTPDCTATVRAVADAWNGPMPHRWQDLPHEVRPGMLSARAPGVLRLGVDERGTTCHVAADAHLVLAGSDASGRTTALRTNLTEWLAETSGQVVLIDPRGSLDGVVPDDHLLAHVGTAGEANATLRSLIDTLGRRLDGRSGPGPHVPVTVAVDDLDLAHDLGVELAVLIPLLPRAESLGLRVVAVARTSSSHPTHRLIALLRDLGASRLEFAGSLPGRAHLSSRGNAPCSLQTTAPVSAVRSGRSPEQSHEQPCA